MLYTIYSTKRSGHHAFIEWLCKGLDGKWLYLNNLKFVKDELHFVKAENNVEMKIPAGKIDNVLKHQWYEFDHILFSCENISEEDFIKVRSYEEKIKTDKCYFGEHKRIVYLRDFFNSYASQFGWFESNQKDIDERAVSRFRESWKFLSKAFLGEIELNASDLHFLSFNNFVFEIDSREDLAHSLSVNNSPQMMSLSKFGGGGNSFFGNPESYSVESQDLEGRWKLVKNKRVYVESVDNEQLLLAHKFANNIGRPELFSQPYEALFKEANK